jgi:hypothetical protein
MADMRSAVIYTHFLVSLKQLNAGKRNSHRFLMCNCVGKGSLGRPDGDKRNNSRTTYERKILRPCDG